MEDGGFSREVSAKSDDFDKHVNFHPRRMKRTIPENEKDDRYWEKRKRNNIAAKRSRENKRAVEMTIRHKMRILEEENAFLRKEVSLLKAEFGVPPDQVFISEEDKAQCRLRLNAERNSENCSTQEMLTEEGMASPTSTTDVKTDPKLSAEHQFAHYAVDYSTDDTTPRSTMDAGSKRRVELSRQQPRPHDSLHLPQTLFYDRSYGTQFMWASARYPAPFNGNVPQIYKDHSVKEEPLTVANNNMTAPPYPQFPRFPLPHQTHNARPHDYVLYKPAPGCYTQHDRSGEPKDLSAPREKIDSHRNGEAVKKTDHDRRFYEEQNGQNRQENASRFDDSYLLSNRRYADNYNLYLMNCSQDSIGRQAEARTAAHIVDQNYSSTQWQQSRSPVEEGGIRFNGQLRSDSGFCESPSEQGDHRVSPGSGIKDHLTAPSSTRQHTICPNQGQQQQQQQHTSQDQEVTENTHQLRRENEDLKIRFRQLFVEMAKMKELVLPN